MPSPPRAGLAPAWIVALLLFAGVWLGAQILHNVTAALTAMTAGPPAAHAPPAWPVRQVPDAAPS